MPDMSFWICQLWIWLGGALVWSMCWALGLGPLRRGSGAWQEQQLLVPGFGSIGRGYKVSCDWLPLVLGFEVFRKGYTVN